MKGTTITLLASLLLCEPSLAIINTTPRQSPKNQSSTNQVFYSDGFIICGNGITEIARGDGCEIDESKGVFSKPKTKKISYREYLKIKKGDVIFNGISIIHKNNTDHVYIFYRNKDLNE